MSESTTDASARQALLALLTRVQAEPGQHTERWQEVELELAVVAEELRAQQEEVDEVLGRLRSQQRLLVHGLGGVPVPMVRLDRHGVVRDANPAAHRLLALPATSLIGKPVVTFVGIEDRGVVRSAFRASQTETAATVAVMLVTRDGQRQRCVLAFARPPVEEVDSSAGMLCLILPLDPAVEDPARIEETAAALAGLCGVSLGNGGLAGALTEVLSLLVGAVPAVAAGRIDWFLEGAAASTAAADDNWGTAWQRAVADVRATGRSSRTEEGRFSVLCVPLMTQDGEAVLAVLSCRGEPEVLDDATAGALAPYGSSASALFVDAGLIRDSERVRAQLEEALASRAVIDQAKGMIMMTVGCSPDEAFQHLVNLSSRQNRKLREVARGLVQDMVRQVQVRRPHG